jgi:hypothetical protein
MDFIFDTDQAQINSAVSWSTLELSGQEHWKGDRQSKNISLIDKVPLTNSFIENLS